jgi:hypothetical protein
MPKMPKVPKMPKMCELPKIYEFKNLMIKESKAKFQKCPLHAIWVCCWMLDVQSSIINPRNCGV